MKTPLHSRTMVAIYSISSRIMTEDTKELCKILLKEIASARQYSQNPAPHDLFMSSETLISGMASLIGPMMDLETLYRQNIKEYMQMDMSNAKAEANAKAEPAYRDWQKIKLVYELADSQIMLLKKFSDKLETEYKRN